ncbi:carbohydrate porin [Novacetimonas pomaceti]|nr:carbohydrate porin [Novacetimonas pomaceti]
MFRHISAPIAKGTGSRRDVAALGLICAGAIAMPWPSAKARAGTAGSVWDVPPAAQMRTPATIAPTTMTAAAPDAATSDSPPPPGASGGASGGYDPDAWWGLRRYFPTSYQSWIHQDTMTGDWGGIRSRLAAKGVDISGHYLEDSSGNPVGGKAQGVRYAHEFGIGVDINFKKLTGHDIGTLHGLITERAGLGLSSSILPALDSVQQIFGSGETVRLTRLSLERHFTRYVDMEAGWVNTENDFAQSTKHWGMSIYCQFQTNAICGMPQSLAMNSGYGWYPTAHPGAYLKLYPLGDERLLVSAGVYNVDNTISNTHNGFKLGLDDSTGTYLPWQLGWHNGGTDEHGILPGNIQIGGYWDTSEVKNVVASHIATFEPANVVLTDLPQDSIRGRYGGWVEADQMVQRDAPGSSCGTVIFGSFIWGDPRTAFAPYFATWGIIRKGTFANRPNDTVSVGGKFLVVNPKLTDYARELQSQGQDAYKPSQENAFELNYGWRATPWATIRPGLQYLWHPGGTNRYRNAFILDFETALVF